MIAKLNEDFVMVKDKENGKLVFAWRSLAFKKEYWDRIYNILMKDGIYEWRTDWKQLEIPFNRDETKEIKIDNSNTFIGLQNCVWWVCDLPESNIV